MHPPRILPAWTGRRSHPDSEYVWTDSLGEPDSHSDRLKRPRQRIADCWRDRLHRRLTARLVEREPSDRDRGSERTSTAWGAAPEAPPRLRGRANPAHGGDPRLPSSKRRSPCGALGLDERRCSACGIGRDRDAIVPRRPSRAKASDWLSPRRTRGVRACGGERSEPIGLRTGPCQRRLPARHERCQRRTCERHHGAIPVRTAAQSAAPIVYAQSHKAVRSWCGYHESPPLAD